jgi:hypothetical protein
MGTNLSRASNDDSHRTLVFSASPSFLPPVALCSVRIIVVLCERCRSPDEGGNALLPRPSLGSTNSRSPGQLPNRQPVQGADANEWPFADRNLFSTEFRNQVPNCFHLPAIESSEKN